MTRNTLPTIAAAAHATRSIATCARLLALAGLEELLEGDGRYTLFAPTDLAFRELPPGGLFALESDPARLRATLEYHIVCSERRLAGIPNGKLATLGGALLTALVTDDGLRLDYAEVSRDAMECSNGVIYEIGAVLLPGFKPVPSEAAQRQSSASPWSGKRRPPRIPVSRPSTAAEDADALFVTPVPVPPISSTS